MVGRGTAINRRARGATRARVENCILYCGIRWLTFEVNSGGQSSCWQGAQADSWGVCIWLYVRVDQAERLRSLTKDEFGE